MTNLENIKDLEKACINPGSVFSDPEELCGRNGLTWEQKIDLLFRWEYDERLLSVAESEGMYGGEGSQLDRVHNAINSLQSSNKRFLLT